MFLSSFPSHPLKCETRQFALSKIFLDTRILHHQNHKLYVLFRFLTVTLCTRDIPTTIKSKHVNSCPKQPRSVFSNKPNIAKIELYLHYRNKPHHQEDSCWPPCPHSVRLESGKGRKANLFRQQSRALICILHRCTMTEPIRTSSKQHNMHGKHQYNRHTGAVLCIVTAIRLDTSILECFLFLHNSLQTNSPC